MDILLVNVPKISTVYPPAATSLLKATVENAGYTSKVVDFNVNLFHKLQNTNFYNDVSNYFAINLEFESIEINTIIDDFYNNCIKTILNHNPKFLGISVFTFECQRATKELLERLRPVYNGKIIVGGAGLSTTGIAAEKNDFGSYLKEKKLIDFYVRGEGENAILKILKTDNFENKTQVTKKDNQFVFKNTKLESAGINNDNFEQITHLDEIPFADYSDIIDLPYSYTNNTIQLPITGSRGCVRKCTFCDIHAFWKKYTYRTGSNIAQEMIYNYERYGIRDFFFTDSLINGSMKSFRELCNSLIEYYNSKSLPEKFFRWGGQFIVRSPRQMKEKDFELAALSGMNGLAMGIESLSEKIRDEMKKGFSNYDMDYTLKQFRKNKINCYFLIIIGYPTETEEDFEETLQMFTKYQGYAIDGTIFGVNLGGTLSIDEGTPLHLTADDLNMNIESFSGVDKIFGLDWINKNNKNLTLLTRIKRRILTQELLMNLGYTVWNGDHQVLRLKEAYEKIRSNTYHNKHKI